MGAKAYDMLKKRLTLFFQFVIINGFLPYQILDRNGLNQLCADWLDKCTKTAFSSPSLVKELPIKFANGDVPIERGKGDTDRFRKLRVHWDQQFSDLRSDIVSQIDTLRKEIMDLKSACEQEVDLYPSELPCLKSSGYNLTAEIKKLVEDKAIMPKAHQKITANCAKLQQNYSKLCKF